jgi:hypothetical protein
MESILVDTTSLIDLCPRTRWGQPKKISALFDDQKALLQYSNRVTAGVEALVLFEDVFTDKPSLERNFDSHKHLKELTGVVKFVNESNADEQARYKEASRLYIPLLTESGEWMVDFMRRHIVAADYDDIRGLRADLVPSTYFRHLTHILTGAEQDFLFALEGKLREYTPFSGAAATNIMRFFYYSATQLKYGCHLSLHPTRASLIDASSTELSRYHYNVGKTILDAFDKEVRGAYYARREKWLGRGERAIKIPLLTSYVLNKAKQQSDIVETALKLRESSFAKQFRNEIATLLSSINLGDNAAVDSVLARINSAVDDWTKSLNFDPMKLRHKISLSVPIFGGLETDVEIPLPMKKLWKGPGDRILIFLHEMLSKSEFELAGN